MRQNESIDEGEPFIHQKHSYNIEGRKEQDLQMTEGNKAEEQKETQAALPIDDMMIIQSNNVNEPMTP